MTIALGILAKDGLVIASDRQVGMPEYLKMGRGKIAFGKQGAIGQPGGNMLAVTGAGNSHYIEHLQREFVNEPFPATNELQKHFAERIHTFYQDHIIPFSGYASSERPDVSMIVAGRRNGAQVLLSSEKSVVTEHYDCCSVGAGAMYAGILLQRLYAPLGLTSAIQLAAYVVFQVKEHVDGCGNETDIIFLRDDGIHWVDREKVTELEGLFREYSHLEARLIHFIFSAQRDSDAAASKAVGAEIRRMRKAVVGLLQSSKPIMS